MCEMFKIETRVVGEQLHIGPAPVSGGPGPVCALEAKPSVLRAEYLDALKRQAEREEHLFPAPKNNAELTERREAVHIVVPSTCSPQPGYYAAVQTCDGLRHLLPVELMNWGPSPWDAEHLVIRYTDVATGSPRRPAEGQEGASAAAARPLVVDSDVRALIICCHATLPTREEIEQTIRAKLPPAEKEKKPSADEGKSRPADERKALSVTLNFLWRPTLNEVDEVLRKEDYNVVVYLGHMTEPAPSDFAALLQFGKKPGAEEDWSYEPPETFAGVIARHPRVQVVLLLACHTWPCAADKFIEAGVPVVVGTHWKIEFNNADTPFWLGGVGAFLSSLATAAALREKAAPERLSPEERQRLATACKVDEAYAAMRRAVDDRHRPGLLPSALAMHIYLGADDNLKFIITDRDLAACIRYARTVWRQTIGIKLQGEVRDSPGASREPRLARAESFIHRTLIKQVGRSKPLRDGPPGQGPDGALPPSQQPRIEIERSKEEAGPFIERLTRERTHLGLEGPWGVGKTMLMRWIAYTLAEGFLRAPDGQAPLPIYVELWRLSQEVEASDQITPEALARAVTQTLGEGVLLADAQSALSHKKRVYLFDGLDEATWLENPLKNIVGHGRPAHDQSTLISARPEAVRDRRAGLPHFHEPDKDGETGSIVELKPFAPADTKQLIELLFGDAACDMGRELLKAWGLEGPDEQGATWGGSLGSVLENPYLVNLLWDIAIKDFERAIEISTITEVLERALPIVIQRRRYLPKTDGRSQPEEKPFLTTAYMIPLAALAFEMRVKGSAMWAYEREDDWRGIDRKAALSAIRECLAEMRKTEELPDLELIGKTDEACAREVLDNLLAHSGMLRRREKGGWIEMHDARYADFLPALHLARLIQGPRNPEDSDDDAQAGYGPRGNALEKGLIRGWDVDCVVDYHFNQQGIWVKRPAESVRSFVSRKAWDEPNWSWPVQFLAGLLEDPSPLLEGLRTGWLEETASPGSV